MFKELKKEYIFESPYSQETCLHKLKEVFPEPSFSLAAIIGKGNLYIGIYKKDKINLMHRKTNGWIPYFSGNFVDRPHGKTALVGRFRFNMPLIILILRTLPAFLIGIVTICSYRWWEIEFTFSTGFLLVMCIYFLVFPLFIPRFYKKHFNKLYQLIINAISARDASSESAITWDA